MWPDKRGQLCMQNALLRDKDCEPYQTRFPREHRKMASSGDRTKSRYCYLSVSFSIREVFFSHLRFALSPPANVTGSTRSGLRSMNYRPHLLRKLCYGCISHMDPPNRIPLKSRTAASNVAPNLLCQRVYNDPGSRSL
jgi:hypothetical protein